jgi:2-iminobutanoate/2-iminopropanoate deaminase
MEFSDRIEGQDAGWQLKRHPLAGRHNLHGEITMSKIKRLSTPYSYSSAVVVGEYVFLGLHRGFGNTFSEQLDDTFTSLKETLGKLYLTLDCLVKVNVWLKRIKDLPDMEKAFTRYFAKDGFPARMTSTTDFIDDECLLMIDGIAYAREE